MNSIIIRSVEPSEVATLKEVASNTFHETFAHDNNLEDIDKYLNHALTIERLQSEFENPHSHFFFAIVDDKIAGYLKLNFGPSQTEIKEDNAMEIQRIYLYKQYHGTGVGEALLDKAFEVAHNHRSHYVWLGVWEHNHRAIRFYQKNGFKIFDSHIFMMGDEAQNDIMMRIHI